MPFLDYFKNKNMKHFKEPSVQVGLFKLFVLSVLLLSVTLISNAQFYNANNLSGLKEEPANLSPGTGMASVTITGTSMRVQATFSGLLGTTTAAHIHAATAVPGAGTAGVATATPSFPGFPLGVTAGTFDMTYDMTDASSYRAGYITANGGTPLSAFAALKAALDNGTSYFNIHSTFAPGGEIRAFFILCPTLSVSIPDAFALPQGTVANTVYPAYAPAASITLNAVVSGGAGPYTYSWSNGETESSATVSPVVTSQYSVLVKDQNNCPGMASTTVEVLDIAGGKNGDKINICHKGNKTLTIGGTDVSDHLSHGDMLGSCTEAGRVPVSVLKKVEIENKDQFSVKVIQNPAPHYFDIRITGVANKRVDVRVYDLSGRAIETRQNLQTNSTLRIGAAYTPGTYMVEVVLGSEKKLLKLMKMN
jgi:hypothetical protein